MCAKRAANGRSTVYLGKDGYWHGRVTVGIRDDGRPDRRHVMSKKKATVVEGVRALERERDAGRVRRAGQNWTVEQWLRHWLDTIIEPFAKENTYSGYRVAVEKHLIPGIGAHRLASLRPEHLEALYVRMLKSKTKSGTLRKPATVHQAHRTVRAALNEAVRRGYLSTNPAVMAKAPRIVEHEVEPYTVDEVRRLLEAAVKRRNTARWAVALALGLRQGEALGLRWSDLDLDERTMVIRRSRLRPKWAHGCTRPCGRKYPGYCPARMPLRADTDDTKSSAGRRVIGLPDPLCVLLRQHRAQQGRERLRAGQLWMDGDWVFATETGRPINPRTDWSEWKRLLKEAGLRDGRLHDARHTAATVLLLLGMSDRVIMNLMGWSNVAMTRRYAHVVEPIRRDAADRVGGLLWIDPTDGPGSEPGRADAK